MAFRVDNKGNKTFDVDNVVLPSSRQLKMWRRDATIQDPPASDSDDVVAEAAIENTSQLQTAPRIGVAIHHKGDFDGARFCRLQLRRRTAPVDRSETDRKS